MAWPGAEPDRGPPVRQGFMSFGNTGLLIVSPVADPVSLKRMGIDRDPRVNAGAFSQGSSSIWSFTARTSCAWRAVSRGTRRAGIRRRQRQIFCALWTTCRIGSRLLLLDTACEADNRRTFLDARGRPHGTGGARYLDLKGKSPEQALLLASFVRVSG